MSFKQGSCCFRIYAILLGLLFGRPCLGADSPEVVVSHELEAKWAYTGGSDIRGGGTEFGSSDEQSSLLRYVLSPQVTRRMLLHFGAEWQRYSFGLSDSALVPNTLQQASAILGFHWQFNDQWLFRADIHPGVYSDFHDVSGRDVDVPILLGAAYLANADLQWVFGVRIDPRSNYPVIPAVGLRWKFAEDWTLNAIVPEPRLEYEINDRLNAYLALGIDAETFRVSDTFGDDRGNRELNAAILDYFEVRIGPGFSWKAWPGAIIEASAGCMVYRSFNFSDQDLVFRSEPAPYVQLGFQFRF
jgi:hypothetical protein